MGRDWKLTERTEKVPQGAEGWLKSWSKKKKKTFLGEARDSAGEFSGRKSMKCEEAGSAAGVQQKQEGLGAHFHKRDSGTWSQIDLLLPTWGPCSPYSSFLSPSTVNGTRGIITGGCSLLNTSWGRLLSARLTGNNGFTSHNNLRKGSAIFNLQASQGREN